LPNPLPPSFDSARLIGPLAEAQHHLGELAGVGRSLSNPYLLQTPFMRREAVSSSAIEGTITTLSELFAFEAGVEREVPRGDTREVHNYVVALEQGFRALETLPICGRLVREAHVSLLKGLSYERGAKNRPGQFRTDPAWTGARLVHEARFVFVPPTHVERAFNDFESFLNADTRAHIPDLVKASLLHYQFEAIHPFNDGNGRVGRLLIPLFLCSTRLLPQPLLFLSPFFERNRDRYISALYEVSRVGAWEDWIIFFLGGVAEQCRDMIVRSRALLDLQAKYRERLQRARASALLTRLVDFVFERPIISIPQAARLINISYNAAKNNIDRMIEEKILKEVPDEVNPKLFVASEVFSTIYQPLDQVLAQSRASAKAATTATAHTPEQRR